MRLIRGAVAMAWVLVTLVACGGPNESGDPRICSLLTAAERESIDGSEINDSLPADTTTIPWSAQCGWASNTANIKVISTPATTWVATLPDLLNQLEESDLSSGQDERDQIAKAKDLLGKSGGLNAGQACLLFATLAELNGNNEDTTAVVNYVPLGENAMTISGQTCTEGRFTSVSYTTDGMTQSAQLEQRVAALRDKAHERAFEALD